jgi:hypothetical protein
MFNKMTTSYPFGKKNTWMESSCQDEKVGAEVTSKKMDGAAVIA